MLALLRSADMAAPAWPLMMVCHAHCSMEEVREQLALRGLPAGAEVSEREAMDVLFWALLDDPQTTLLGVRFCNHCSVSQVAGNTTYMGLGCSFSGNRLRLQQIQRLPSMLT